MNEWRRLLIDLSYRNRLIKYRTLQASSLQIASPSVETVVKDPGRTAPWRFFFPPDIGESSAETETQDAIDAAVASAASDHREPQKDELVTGERDPKRLNRILDNLAKKSNAEFQDKGLRVLYLAAGFLEWVDPSKDEALRSPLVLVPVRLERKAASRPYELFFVDDEETVINPSLAEKLRQDTNIDLPDDFFWEDKPILTELGEIAAAVQPHGWTVTHDVVLGLFSFQKYVMYRDLLDNAAAVGRHPIVRALATQAPFDVPDAWSIDLHALDDEQAATRSFSILDADSTQRACIEAAKRGRSFVMHGPPGTGKSQTIANIIAEAISMGRRVLFVSEKAAALDVVHSRLASRGLSDYCLKLHGEHASRREVVDALNTTLTSELRPRRLMDRADLDRHDRLREYLNAQVAALHDPEPILGGRSIREVAALLAELYDALQVPGAPPTSDRAGCDVDAEYQQFRDLFGRIAERWYVGASDYPWRGYEADAFTADDRARVLKVTERLQRACSALESTIEMVCADLGWSQPTARSGGEALVDLLDHLQGAPVIHAHWIDAGAPAEINAAVEAAEAAWHALTRARTAFQSTYTDRQVEDLHADSEARVEAALESLAEAGGRTKRWDKELLPRLGELAAQADAVAAHADEIAPRVTELLALLGQPDVGVTLGSISTSIDLARLAFDPPARPEAEWLVRAGLTRAEECLGDVGPLLAEFRERIDSLSDAWNLAVLDLDVRPMLAGARAVTATREKLLRGWTTETLDKDAAPLRDQWNEISSRRAALEEHWSDSAFKSDSVSALATRFETMHVSLAARLRAGYRRDIKALRELRRAADKPESPVDAITELARWQVDYAQARADLAAARNRELTDAVIASALDEVLAYQEAHAKLASQIAPYRRHQDAPDDLVADLAFIQTTVDTRASIRKRGTRASAAFGSYWREEHTRLDELRHALDAARKATALRDPGSDLPILTAQLCVGASPDTRVAQIADQVEGAFARLRDAAEPLAAVCSRIKLADDRRLAELRDRAAKTSAALETLNAVVVELDRGSLRRAQTVLELTDRASLVSELHAHLAKVAAHQEEWAAALGPSYSGNSTDWQGVRSASAWLGELFAKVEEIPPPVRAELIRAETSWPDRSNVVTRLQEHQDAIDELADLFAGSRADLIDRLENSDCGFGAETARELAATVDTLGDWVDFATYRRRLVAARWGPFIEALLADAQATGEDVVASFERAYWSRRHEAALAAEPDLAEDLRGGTYQRFIDDFTLLDRRLVDTGPDRLMAVRNDEHAPHIALGGGEVSILKTEAGKLRRHKPVRRLLAEIPVLLGQLKPCLMMSPLSVSHFLGSNHTFDLVIFDEASQVPPQDAINCIYRGEQLIVAGDSRQLPPTSFFQVAEVGDATDDGEVHEDMESVLDACTPLLPEQNLRWHYRSRHEDLIAFSNERVYDGGLVTFPTPDHSAQGIGVTFTYVPNGVYERGRTQTNKIEAAAVASRLVELLKSQPTKSIGVIAFNAAQATAIQDEVDLLRLRDPSLESHFAGDRLDAPFVKHLESVQGDERDTIVFSIGYGRDADGKFLMNFGPLNKSGGHRRLNVAVTRARERVEVFASVTHRDFTLSDSASQGARLLRDYLAYAELATRRSGLDELGDAEHFAVTGVEREIAREVERLGYRALHQVGAGAVRIPVAVFDPANNDRFTLAIETDGEPYRQTATARDRDRLRSEVLRTLGWHVHRVWAMDWLRDRNAEIARLEAALLGEVDDEPASNGRVPAADEPERVDRVVVDLRDPDSLWHLPWVSKYERIELPYQHAAVDFHDPLNRGRLKSLAEEVLHREAPIHVSAAVRRLAEAFGIARVGNRVDAAARQAISDSARATGYVKRGDFYWRGSERLHYVRRPAPDDPRTRREIDLIPPEEIDLCISNLLTADAGISDDVLLPATARILGFDRTGDRVKDALERRVRAVRRKARSAS